MKLKKLLPGILAAAMMSGILAGCSSNQIQGNANAETRKSGTITLYTSQPEKDVQALVEGFNKKQPDIKVQVFRSGTEEIVSKVMAEKQAGAVLADLLLVADSVTFESLKEQDMLKAYASPELKGISNDYIDKDNMYTGTKVITTGIIYNTNLVKEPIKSFGDLLKENVKEGIIMPSPLYSGAAAYNLGVITRASGLGWEFYQGLKSNGVKVDKGNGAVLKAVAAGEKACGVIVDYMAVRSKAQGNPVEFVYPSEGSPSVTEPVGILKETKNEELAKIFVDYVLSAEGQQLAANMGYTPVKSGVKAPEGMKSICDIKNMTNDITTLYKQREADKTEFTKLFQ